MTDNCIMKEKRDRRLTFLLLTVKKCLITLREPLNSAIKPTHDILSYFLKGPDPGQCGEA